MPRTWQRGRNAEFLGRAAKLAQRRKWGALLLACRTALAKASPCGLFQIPKPSKGNLITLGRGSGSKVKQVGAIRVLGLEHTPSIK